MPALPEGVRSLASVFGNGQLPPIYRVRVTERGGLPVEDVMHVTAPQQTGDGVCFESGRG